MRLRFCSITVLEHAKYGGMHPQAVMRDLGITYTGAIPAPIADCWVFDGCDNVPPKEALPNFLQVIQ